MAERMETTEEDIYSDEEYDNEELTAHIFYKNYPNKVLETIHKYFTSGQHCDADMIYSTTNGFG